MVEIRRMPEFQDWMRRLRDRAARARIVARIDRLAIGNPGDVRPVGEGVSEIRLTYGPGYRIYFLSRGDTFVMLLCGGDKSTQIRDIERALTLARRFKNDGNY